MRRDGIPWRTSQKFTAHRHLVAASGFMSTIIKAEHVIFGRLRLLLHSEKSRVS